MEPKELGRVLLIVNPAAHSGNTAEAACYCADYFQKHTRGFSLVETKAPGDARAAAENSSHFDSLIALGGDGLIHEIISGLMTLDKRSRPKLGIIAYGTGNDIARTLRLPFNDYVASLAALLTCKVQNIDLGCVCSDEVDESVYFAETLSFGLDARVAIDTNERKRTDSDQKGSSVFLRSAIRTIAAGAKGYPCRVSIDDKAEFSLTSIIFAVQNGPSYGGGFKICPKANPFDGMLDLCYTTTHPSLVHQALLLALARFGKHTNSRALKFERATSINIGFEQAVPCQTDGEELKGTSFEISICPEALSVYVAGTL